jgi:hypothetical protein
VAICAHRLPVGILAAVLTWAGGAPLGAADDQLEALLDRASAYEIAFVGAFQNIVAEEVLVQETSAPHRKRTLKSDFLFVNYPGIKGSIVLRDVFEVDGKPVRDAAQAERMMRLFTSPVRNAVARAAELANEGARYNLWDIGTLNNPLIAMAFLQPDYRTRFRFNLAGMEKSLGPTVRTVRFQEWQLPTILRAGANNDLLARGLIWVDETNGRVVKTRLQVGSARIPPEIVTTFRRDADLGIDVPAEMRDWYPDDRLGDVKGVATYGRFRRFEVRTEESLDK